jgi:hypothetical protein
MIDSFTTSGCPWPKATVKSPMGARNLRPLFFIFSYFLLFIFYCPGRPALPCPVSNFPFAARDRRRKLHRERAVFVFPFAARDRRRKLHRERAVLFFPFAARYRRRKLHPALQDRQTDRQTDIVTLIY